MFKIVWDPEYNGVRLTMSSKGDALNVSPRPVFWEELDLLGLNARGWIYPHVEEPLLWACDRRYFYKGEFVEFYPKEPCVEKFFLATEEIHRLNGGRWKDFSWEE